MDMAVLMKAATEAEVAVLATEAMLVTTLHMATKATVAQTSVQAEVSLETTLMAFKITVMVPIKNLDHLWRKPQ